MVDGVDMRVGDERVRRRVRCCVFRFVCSNGFVFSLWKDERKVVKKWQNIASCAAFSAQERRSTVKSKRKERNKERITSIYPSNGVSPYP